MSRWRFTIARKHYQLYRLQFFHQDYLDQHTRLSPTGSMRSRLHFRDSTAQDVHYSAASETAPPRPSILCQFVFMCGCVSCSILDAVGLSSGEPLS